MYWIAALYARMRWRTPLLTPFQGRHYRRGFEKVTLYHCMVIKVVEMLSHMSGYLIGSPGL